MYSLTGRLNNFLFNTLMTLAIFSMINFMSERFVERQPANVSFKVLEFKELFHDRYINEDASSFITFTTKL